MMRQQRLWWIRPQLSVLKSRQRRTTAAGGRAASTVLDAASEAFVIGGPCGDAARLSVTDAAGDDRARSVVERSKLLVRGPRETQRHRPTARMTHRSDRSSGRSNAARHARAVH